MKTLIVTLVSLLLMVGYGGAQVVSSPVLSLLTAANTTGASLEVDATRWGVLGVDIILTSGTATIGFEGAVDTTYRTVGCYPVAGGAIVTSTAASGSFRCTVAGLKTFRLNVTACGSCVITAKAVGSSASANGS